MPASMMSAPVGSTFRVSGISIAIVAMGPTPGSTPISVPTRQPTKPRKRLVGESAVAKPRARLLKSSMSVTHQPGSQGDGKPERVLEESDAEKRHQHPVDERLAPAHLARGERCRGDRERAGDCE